MTNSNVTFTQSGTTVTVQTIPNSEDVYSLEPLQVTRQHSPNSEKDPVNILMNTGKIINSFLIYGTLDNTSDSLTAWGKKEALKDMMDSIELVTMAWTTDDGSLSVTGMIRKCSFKDNGPEAGPDHRWSVIIDFVAGQERP